MLWLGNQPARILYFITMENNRFDVIVLGGGPAGLTAAIYLSRARLRTLVLNIGTAGGQMVLTHEVANYPGVESVSGYTLSNTMKKQAKSFGSVIKNIASIQQLTLNGDVKQVVTGDGTVYESDAVILATGGRSRELGVEGERQFKGKGISYCATCDGEFFTDKEIIVIGGGNSALEEAVSLTKYASHITIVHQFDYFQAFEYAIEEAKQNTKISFKLNSVISKFQGGESFDGAYIKDVNTGEESFIKSSGAFIFIGYQPNTEVLKGIVELNKWGEIVVDSEMKTSLDGVFAAGDAIAKRYRQITTSVGEATVAALATAGWLHEQRRKKVSLAH